MKKQLLKNGNLLGKCMSTALLTLFAGLASAQTVFDQADSSADGAIDPEEFRNYMADIFFHLDSDRSGQLGGEELELLNPERLPGTDKNSDGLVSMNEFLNSTAQDFFQLDTDHNNMLIRKEIR